MFELDHIGVRNRVIDKVVDDANLEGRMRTIIEGYSLLPINIQRHIVDRVIKSQGSVVSNCINNRTPIALPYIGKVEIKKGKLFEIEVMTEVVELLGYDDITSVPKDKYIKLLAENKEIISNKAIVAKVRRNNNRKSVTNAKIQTFDLKKLKNT